MSKALVPGALRLVSAGDENTRPAGPRHELHSTLAGAVPIGNDIRTKPSVGQRYW